MNSRADSKALERGNESPDRTSCARKRNAASAYQRHPLIDVWSRDRSALLGLCLRWTAGNVSEAEDLLGDACLRVIEGSQCAGVVFDSPFAFWATVINNLARDRLRRARLWKFESGLAGAELVFSLPAGTDNAEQEVVLRERLCAAERQISYLTDRQRSALLLRCRGLDYSEIGETLSTSVVNARKLVETARRFLNEAPRSRVAGVRPLNKRASEPHPLATGC